MEIADLVLAPDKRAARVDHRRFVHKLQFDRLRNGKDLEGRTKLIDALQSTVEQRAIVRVALNGRQRAVVRVKVGQAHNRDHFARVDIHQDARSTLRAHQTHPAIKHALGRRLYSHINRQLQRPRAIGGVAQIFVKLLFNASRADHFSRMNTFAAKARSAHNMRRQRAVRIQPRLTWTKQQTWFANVMHLLELLRADLLFHPNKLAFT